MTVEGTGRDEERSAVPPGGAGANESSQRKCDRFSRRADHLAKKPMLMDFQLEAPVICEERAIARQSMQRRDQSLLDILRRQFVKSLDSFRSLAEKLADELQRLTRSLANQLAKFGGRQKKRFGIFGGKRIGDVDGIARQTFDAESLSGNDDGRNESAS